MHTFFDDITPIDNLSAITDPEHFQAVPSDWWVAVTDVVGSTKAIERGLYKEVNAVAAASITALLNAVPETDLPFVFGGDGASILIPPEMEAAARGALRGAQILAQQQFELDLRVGMIPVADVLAAGYHIDVARLWMGEAYQQAIFTGGGMAYVEQQLKHSDQYNISPETPDSADFSHFECRWTAVPSPYDEVISLIVQASDPQTYQAVLSEITRVYGDKDTRHPISDQNLRLTFSPLQLSVEARVRRSRRDPLTLLGMVAESTLVQFLMIFDISNWASYKPNFIRSTDHEKFDDSLRMTIAGTAPQRASLIAFLDAQQAQGNLVYGIHISTESLVTCIVFDYFGRQVHLVDGQGGGYALAARQMKAAAGRLATQSLNPK
ncbi:MAG: DUF3095 domain-containing protein [Chloroflexi bacterium]|nr:DUF3095 domain-containing protein [Chloroflexota bacterium]